MFFEIGGFLYKAFLQEKAVATVPEEYVDITKRVIKRIGWHTQVKGVKVDGKVDKMPENKKVMVALSGGLDSVYLMHKLIDQGYIVYAVHIAGLNKQSANYETTAAQEAAKQAGAKFIKINFSAPKQAFPDNPFKNQMILSMMLDLGIKKGIYRYAVGSDWTTPLKEAVVGFTITDAAEVYKAFWDGVKSRFKQAELVFIQDNEKKYERLIYLSDKKALDNVSSCISPFRFRASLHEKNEKKYKIRLLKNRCGSCYKCAMEYILLCEAKKISKNAAFYEHSWDVLATSKTAHRPDLFKKSLPFEKKMENLKNYGS